MNTTMKNKQIFETLPYPNWKRLTLPPDVFGGEENGVQPTVEVTGNGLTYQTMESFITQDLHGGHPHQPFMELEKHSKRNLGEKFLSYTNGYYNGGLVIHAQDRGGSPNSIRLKYDYKPGQVTNLNHLIIAESGAKVDVLMDFEGQGGKHFGVTRVVAKPGSEVRLIKLQRLDDDSLYFDQNFTLAEEGSQVAFIDVQLGAGLKAVSYETDLKGRYTMADLKSIYYGEKDQQIDVGYTMVHHGEKTQSTIYTKGALDGNAKKVFRGNLIFNHGARQSVGKEEEFVVVLSDGVRTDSIPALMCSEDDVVGEHAASVGQIDKEQLFYLMSRGFSEHEAKKMMIKGAFEAIVVDLPYEDIRNQIILEIERRV